MPCAEYESLKEQKQFLEGRTDDPEKLAIIEKSLQQAIDMHRSTCQSCRGELKLDDIRRLRSVLFRRLLFEPVTDPDFDRPSEKLRTLTNESTHLISRLRTVVDSYDQCLAWLAKAQNIFEQGRSYLETVRAFGMKVSSAEEIITDIITSSHLSNENREIIREEKQVIRQLQAEARDLSRTFLALSGELVVLPLTLRTYQLITAQLWAFLEENTAAIVKGTTLIFHKHANLATPSELFSDVIDEAVDHAKLPKLTPVMHLVKLVFEYIRRQDIREEQIEGRWTEFELNVFLMAFFTWWTGAGGGAAIEHLVLDCEKSLRIQRESTQRFGSLAGEFGRAVGQFQTKIDQNVQGDS